MKKLILLVVPFLFSGCLVLSFGDNVFHSPKKLDKKGKAAKKAKCCPYSTATAVITSNSHTFAGNIKAKNGTAPKKSVKTKKTKKVEKTKKTALVK